jgi:hypothetical protein
MEKKRASASAGGLVLTGKGEEFIITPATSQADEQFWFFIHKRILRLLF